MVKPCGLLLGICILALLHPAASAQPAVALSVIGLPPGAEPQLRAALAAQLELSSHGALRIREPRSAWFWRARPDSIHLRVQFERYHAGPHRRTLIPLVAARYAYRLDARGSVALLISAGDSVVATLPFAFDWQRPTAYQFAGVAADAASVQVRAPECHELHQEALHALTVDLARKLLRMHERDGPP